MLQQLEKNEQSGGTLALKPDQNLHHTGYVLQTDSCKITA